MKKYDPEAKCVKCGSDNINDVWRSTEKALAQKASTKRLERLKEIGGESVNVFDILDDGVVQKRRTRANSATRKEVKNEPIS